LCTYPTAFVYNNSASDLHHFNGGPKKGKAIFYRILRITYFLPTSSPLPVQLLHKKGPYLSGFSANNNVPGIDTDNAVFLNLLLNILVINELINLINVRLNCFVLAYKSLK